VAVVAFWLVAGANSLNGIWTDELYFEGRDGDFWAGQGILTGK
jgi:hypothetical protein